MSESFYEKSEQLAHDYLGVREKLRSEEKVDIGNLSQKIQKLEEKLQKLPENSVLWTRIKKHVDELKKQSEEAGEFERELENTKNQILELTVSSFEIDPEGEKRLSDSYIKALTGILLGKEKNLLEFHECTVKSDGIEIVKDKVRALIISANICEFIQEATKKKLGKSTTLDEFWNRITKTKEMFKVYAVLARQDKVMSASEVASSMGEEDWDRRKAKNNLNNLLLDHLFDHKIIRRVDRGKYQVSDVGRFLWSEYGSPIEPETIKEQNNSSGARSQSALNTWTKS